MSDHAYEPSGHTASTGTALDSCLRCGQTEAAHRTDPPPVKQGPRVEFPWAGKQWAFESPEAALAAGFYLEGL